MERENLELQLKKLVEENNLSLYRCSFEKQEGMDVFHIELDGEVDLDKCEYMSQLIGDYLEENNVFENPYILDVCSVGLEKEITLEQLPNCIGNYIYVQFNHELQSMQEVEGYLLSCDDLITVEYLDKTRKKKISFGKDEVAFMRNAVKF